jgi:heat shock protein HtpX
VTLQALLDEASRSERQRTNRLHAILLVAGIAAVLAAATFMIWGMVGVAVTFAVVAGIVLLSPRVPPETIMRLYRATPLAPSHAGPLDAVLSVLAARADLPRAPSLYVIPSMALNAFATGTRERSAIGVTEGLLRRLTMREIAEVMAHEISHVRNGDLRVMGLADVMSRFVQSLSYVAVLLAFLNLLALMGGEEGVPWIAILLLYLAPAVAGLLQLALSRSREFHADHEGAMFTGDPLGLASALRRLESYTGTLWEEMTLPVPARRIPVPSVLRTHPETEERIERLIALKDEITGPPLAVGDGPMISLVGLGPGQMRPRYRWPGLWY